MAGDGIGITSRIAKATLALWFKELQDHAYKNNVLLEILEKKGRVKKADGGGHLRWVFRKNKYALSPSIDASIREFARQDHVENAFLRWGAYEVTDVITEQEYDEHRGSAAVVELLRNKTRFMKEDANEAISQQLYVDGSLAANSTNRTWHGLESFMAITPGSQVNTDDLATVLADTYAAHSTVYQNTAFGASSSTPATAPNYGVWSPVIVNCNQVDASAATQAWSDFADVYIRRGLLHATHGKGKDDRPDLIVLTRTAYEQLCTLLSDKEQLNFSRGGEVGKAAFGFPLSDGIDLNGCAVTWDLGVPTPDASGDTVYGYMLTTGRVSLHLNMEGKGIGLWRMITDYEPAQAADLLRIRTSGNLMFDSPRYFGKFAAIS